jgi:adenosylmethionine-8-amino-7-oxononanoate aminotransferase
MATMDKDVLNADEIWRKDRDHILHPWTHFDSFREGGSLAVARGEGCYIFDTNGQRYLDANGGLWCNNIGLGRKDMAVTIAEQVERLAYSNTFSDMTSVSAAELAAKLAEIAPGNLNHVFFTTGGSQAIDTAYRLIQFYQRTRGKVEKRHIISREGSYHGSTYMAMSIGGKKADHIPQFDYETETIHHVSSPNVYRAPDGMSESEFCDHLIDELESKIQELGSDEVAAFFAEPIMGAGGVIVPPADYHRRTRELCTEHDVLYVSDEVVTGFGRLGEWFSAKDVFGIQPDLITCAKGITSGYLPLGGLLYSDEIHEVISGPDPDRVFAHGFTYSGHPVCCAAALENIRIIEDEHILEQVRENGPYLQARLRELLELPTVGDVRGLHLMACVESVEDKATKRPFPDDVNIGKRVSSKCQEAGLIVRPIAHLNVLSPSLIITRQQIDFCVDTLAEAMIAVGKDLGVN